MKTKAVASKVTNPLRFLSLLVCSIVCSVHVTFSFTAAAAAAASAEPETKEPFPKLVPFFDLIALPKPKQEAYIQELRETLAGAATSEAPGQVRLFVQGEDVPTSFIKQMLFTPAYAAWDGRDPVGQKCDNGKGDQILCVSNAGGTTTNCLCAYTHDSFVSDYGADVIPTRAGTTGSSSSGTGCGSMSSDSGASQDITANYKTVYIGGSASCVTQSSYDNVQNLVGSAELKGSLHDALTDPERSKAFEDKSKRFIHTDQIAAQIASAGSAINPMNGVKTDHVFERRTLAAEAQKKAFVAVAATEKVKDEAHLTGASDETARKLAREATDKNLKLASAAITGAKQDGVNADLESQRQLLEAQKIDPKKPSAQVMDAVGNGIETAGASGLTSADLKKAASNLDAAGEAMKPTADDAAGTALKKETTETSAAAKAAATELLAKGQDVVDTAVNTLKGPLDAAATDKQAKLKALQASLADLKISMGRGAKDDIEAKTEKATDTLKAVRQDLNLPPQKESAMAGPQKPAPGEPPVTCIKTGTFKCPNRKVKAGTEALDKARATLLAQDGEKSCIFGGNASTFGANVEGRGVKSRKGCAPKFDFDLKIGDNNYKLTCPPATKNQRLVICNPVLYGYENGADGNPAQAHCVDWTSMVTADCNYKYPLRKSTKKPAGKSTTTSVSPIDLLNNEKAQLEPGWENLSRAISRHCNSEAFRSLNCSECELISSRLGQMKVKATEGTCTWPSEIGTIRSSMKGTVK